MLSHHLFFISNILDAAIIVCLVLGATLIGLGLSMIIDMILEKLKGLRND